MKKPLILLGLLAVLGANPARAQTAATPTFGPPAGAFAAPQSVAIATRTQGAAIYYTTDGSTPTSGSTLYSAPISVSSTTTIKALAVQTVSSISISPANSTIATGQSITFLASDNNGNVLTGGLTWQSSDPTIAPITSTGTGLGVAPGVVTSTATLANPIINSAVATGLFSIESQVATPTFSPSAGTYTSSPQSVTLSDSTGGSSIYYTTDGSAPTVGSMLYTGAISVGSSETVKAFATHATMVDSAAGSAAYTINQNQTATPTFGLAPGTYSGTQSVTLSDSTGGSSIYYTTDGSAPTVGSTLYTGAISVPATATIRAIAAAAGLTNSGIASGPYTITAAVSPAPAIGLTFE